MDLRLVIAGLATAIWMFPLPSQADLIGDTASCAFTGGTAVCSPANAVVGNGGPEFTITAGPGVVDAVDVDASSFTITALQNFAFGTGTLTLSGLDFTNPQADIVGVLLTNNGVGGLTDSDISFALHLVSVALAGTQWLASQGDFATFQLLTSPAQVPEPGTLGLLGLGLAGLGLVGLGFSRRKQ
jgi:hypothetical protein